MMKGRKNILAVHAIDWEQPGNVLPGMIREYFDEGTDNLPKEIYSDEKQEVVISTEYLQLLAEIAREAKGDQIRLNVETNKPVVAEFLEFENSKYTNHGSVVISPRLKPEEVEHG